MQIDSASLVNRADRLSLGRTGTLRDPARSPIDVEIEDLSETGALLRTEEDLPVGTLISLGIAGLGMQMARIARVSTGLLAAEFVVQLDPQAVARIATGEPLPSVAIPQLPIRLDEEQAPAPAANGGALATIVPLPIKALPTPQTAQLAAEALTYDARGAPPVEAPTVETVQIIDPRILSGLVVEQRSSPTPANTGKNRLWLLLFGAVLVTGLAMLIR